MSKIAIIGHFGGKENITDGQTVKTKTLYEELAKNTKWQIKTIDTYYKKTKPIQLLLQVIYTLVSTKKIIVLLSGNGMKFFFPLFFVFSKTHRTEVYHDVIGGNLDDYIVQNKRFVKYLNSFKKNWVETESLKKRVEACGVTNCEVIPNFKRLRLAEIKSFEKQTGPPFRFCTFSRVMKEKGIEEAVKAVESINYGKNTTICTLDIYGLIDVGYKEEFYQLLARSSDAIRYCGIVDYNKSVDTIERYYALLFPTTWSGEGFPGTIIDSFSAGLPVIATDWNSNGELISNMNNGIIYPNLEMNSLTECIKWIITHPTERQEMSKKCIQCAEQYCPDIYIKRIIKETGI